MTVTQAEGQNGARPLAPRVPAASRIGQGTAVEQSRAVAEVEAAIVVALRHPRDIERAVSEMQRSCAQKSLAEKAFFRYSRGAGQISGPSVQLARELARAFGNIQYGITELRRDDEYGQSEMQAWCWDVQTNTRSSTTFVVPHIRDTSNGPKQLVDMRDIYEMNANMGARRLREMIFAILPGWFTEDAVEACYRTLKGNDGDQAQRAAKCIQTFADLGVTSRQLVQKIGSPVDKWTPYDLATLTVIYRSLERGEIRKDDEFAADGPEPVTAAEILSQQAVPAPGRAAATPAQAESPASAGSGSADAPAASGKVASNGASQLVHLITQVPLGKPEDVSEFLSWRAGHPVTGLVSLTREDVIAVTAYLDKALEDAEGDGATAAGKIWDAYRAELAAQAQDQS